MKMIVFVVRVGKPVRCMLDRDEDMMSTGTRHPFLAKYKVLHISVTRLFMRGVYASLLRSRFFLRCHKRFWSLIVFYDTWQLLP